MSINLKQLLTEALDNLYHATDLGQLRKILDTDAIKFTYSDSVDTEEKLNRGFPFYLSTSREKYGGYARSRTNHASMPVILVLDAKAFERTRGVKMFDVDYWGKDFETPENLRHAETEERIVSTHQVFKGLKKYVQEIHIFVPKRTFDGHSSRAIYLGYVPLAKKTKESGIPTYFYVEGRTRSADVAFRQQRKSMAINGDQLIDTFQVYGVYDPNAPVDDSSYVSRWEDSDIKDLEVLAQVLVHPEDFVHIDYSTNKELFNLIEYFVRYQRDLVSHFGTKIHNLRSKHPAVFQDIAKAIRSKKYTNFKDAIITTSEILTFLKQADYHFNDKREDRTTNLKYIVNNYQLEGQNEKRSKVARYLMTIKDKPALDKEDFKQLALIISGK